MRILHILEATGGGTRRHVLDLLPELQRRGAACSLIYSPLRNPRFRDDAAMLQEAGIQTREIAMGHSYQRTGDAAALRQLVVHLQSHHYDLIHCHSSNAGLLGRLANSASRRSAPLVYTPHYIALAAGLPPLQRRAARWFEKLLAPRTTHYIAVSHHEYGVLRRARLLKNNNATIIYNGVDIEAFPPTPPPAPHPLTIGCFGRLTAQKNQQLLIGLLPALLREFPTARLRLVGEGESEAALRALAAHLGCASQVDFRCDRHDVLPEFADCDVVALPSRWEGCSYALLEAMASGKAVVASTRGGNPEVVGAAGVLLPLGDTAAWSRTIAQLLHDAPRRRSLGDTARERTGLHFRLEAMVEKTFELYQRILR